MQMRSCSKYQPIKMMEHFNVDDDYEKRLSFEIEGDECDSLSSNRFRVLQQCGMTRLEENGLEHQSVTKSFVSGLGSLGRDAKVVAVHKNWSSNFVKVAREEVFRIFSDALATKCGGDANIQLSWYGAPIEKICQIVSHGFDRLTFSSKHDNDTGSQSPHGIGVYLSPHELSIDCVSSSIVDKNGVRHMLLCKVILGKVECIPSGSSTQFHPSSTAFDSGVDNSFTPTKYIVWPAFMNSYIQPTHVISFKAPHPHSAGMKSVNMMIKPTSPWMSFPTLMFALSRFLDRRTMSLIQKCHDDFIRNNIPRSQLINRVRHIAGDDLLIAIIRQYKTNEVFSIA